MRLMSTRTCGFSSRKFNIGTRLWPPARIFASPLAPARIATASRRLVGAAYSNDGGFIRLLPGRPTFQDGAFRGKPSRHSGGAVRFAGRKVHRSDLHKKTIGEKPCQASAPLATAATNR